MARLVTPLSAFLLDVVGMVYLGTLTPSAPQAFVLGIVVGTLPSLRRNHGVGWRTLLWDAAAGGALYLAPHLAGQYRTF